MPYVTVAPQHAEQLSRSIMRLLRPSHLRGEDWTDLYCSVLTHLDEQAKRHWHCLTKTRCRSTLRLTATELAIAASLCSSLTVR
jgi:hypothetical protein